MIKTIVCIAIGGAIGSVLRFLTSVLVNKYWSNHFPMATLITNLIGCFLIGFFLGMLEKNHLENSSLKWFLVTGFCGGYTTFSAFGYENLKLLENQNSIMAFVYISLSIIIGIFAVWMGLFVNKLV